MDRDHALMKEASTKLSPIQCYEDGLPIYFLTGRKYIHQTLFCIRSLVNVSSERFCIYLVDDGSFDNALISRISKQLPGSIPIGHSEMEKRVNQVLPKDQFPALNRKIAEYPHIKKITNVHLLSHSNPYKLVLDSDMLFWQEPTSMLTWLKNPNQPLHMLDCAEAYGYPIDALSQLAGHSVEELVNVGAIALKTSAIDWAVVEAWIVSLEDQFGKSYYLEQALSAMLLGAGKSVVLSRAAYIVNPTPEDILQFRGILHHYVDVSKKGYYRTAWRAVANV